MIVDALVQFLRWENLVAIVIVWIVYKIISLTQNPLRKIPGPKGSIIYGNTFDLASPNDAQQVIAKWREQYGELFKIWTVSGGYSVHISNQDYIRQVLVQDSCNYARQQLDRKKTEHIFPGISLFEMHGNDHLVLRKMLSPAFSFASVQKFIPIFNRKVEQLIEYWENKIEECNGSSFEEHLLHKFTQLTLDVIGKSSFGYEFNSISGNHTEESMATDRVFRGVIYLRQLFLENLFPFLRLFPSKNREDFQKSADLFNNMICTVVEQRKEEMTNLDAPKNEDLLQLMIEMKDQKGNKFSNVDLLAQVRAFMMAGHETTGTAMTWTVLLLSKYPRIQSKVRSEIKEILGKGEELTYEKLSKMKYLDNCIKESMRLYPIAVQLGRAVLEDVTIGPYKIPKGSTVFIDIGVAHRDPEFWKDPEVFNPDRFDEPVLPYRYLPFSRGPRMCLGYRFAELEMKIVLARLFRSFHFGLGKNQGSNFKAELVLTLMPNPDPVVEISKID